MKRSQNFGKTELVALGSDRKGLREVVMGDRKAFWKVLGPDSEQWGWWRAGV